MSKDGKVTITFTVDADHPKIKRLKTRAESFPMSMNQLCKILFMGGVDPEQSLLPANPVEYNVFQFDQEQSRSMHDRWPD